jgi:hypothetical protein
MSNEKPIYEYHRLDANMVWQPLGRPATIDERILVFERLAEIHAGTALGEAVLACIAEMRAIAADPEMRQIDEEIHADQARQAAKHSRRFNANDPDTER